MLLWRQVEFSVTGDEIAPGRGPAWDAADDALLVFPTQPIQPDETLPWLPREPVDLPPPAPTLPWAEIIDQLATMIATQAPPPTVIELREAFSELLGWG